MFGVRRRKVRAKPTSTAAPPSTTSSTATSDVSADYICNLSAAAQSETNLAQPPPYSLICPPQHSSVAHMNQQRPRPPTATSTTTRNSPQSTFAVWTQPHHARTSLDVSRASAVARQGTKNFNKRWQVLTLQDNAQETLQALISTKLDSVITSIDGEEFGGREQDLLIREDPLVGLRGGGDSEAVSRGANRAVSTALVSTNYFAKVHLYANSKLPPNLPALQLSLPTYPLLCLAANYSQRAYAKPTGEEREAFVNADWRMGTKAMVIKSVPIDDMNCVVFAIRGSQTFMDWAVNLNSAPVSPVGFLDDSGNLCHSGFLSVARKMVKPVAARLRSLLEENPSRSTCSLLLTGHSAGGAVASLLYAHMLAEGVRSELSILTGCEAMTNPELKATANIAVGFKRIHCITFGTPPISLLPLNKPATQRHKKSHFISFINEGDPVPRADKAYVRSLLNLYASPAPGTKCITSVPVLKPCKRPKAKRAMSAPAAPAKAIIWKVPLGELSNAGSLAVLREPRNASAEAQDDVKAEITTDQELRTVVFGDPVMHMMRVYARRIEVLATKAVTARIWT